MFGFFRPKRGSDHPAAGLYRAIVAQSREPVFYEDYGVPDTIDGRFDLICLHAFLVMDRLYENGRPGRKLAQALFDIMFHEMDDVLREMGIGDLSVPRHMKRMMKGFNGRATAYQQVMYHGEPEELEEVIARNLYGSADADPGEDVLKIMALYMHETCMILKTQPWDALAQGHIELKAMSYEEDEDGRKKSGAGMVA